MGVDGAAGPCLGQVPEKGSRVPRRQRCCTASWLLCLPLACPWLPLDLSMTLHHGFSFKSKWHLCHPGFEDAVSRQTFTKCVFFSPGHLLCLGHGPPGGKGQHQRPDGSGKIPELLPMGSIDEQTRLVLVNAIYFQGTWDEKFDKPCTKEMPFKINQEEEWPVQMMWQEANFNFIYISEAQTKVLELPYAGKTLSMIILLPDEDVDLSVVENNLTFEKFIAWTKAASLQNTEVEVFLPRFKLQEDYEMKSVLQRLGMVDAFQPGQADLSAMSTETDLCLSKVVHKSVVEVNEEGTEAAAATAVNIVLFGSSCKPTFCANHPFLFFIRHNETNTVLFCGRFSSP
ncbi:serpin B9-like isoform X3 [Marmota marmota marmota]|uniref:serpin B9-like isoform X3 n=1 Tax=Marmota marmota marmota TaxID=9994 RepID=UPI0020930903|nr:serpin B9-like isoform X3 [Marmota marmota marmota]